MPRIHEELTSGAHLMELAHVLIVAELVGPPALGGSRRTRGCTQYTKETGDSIDAK